MLEGAGETIEGRIALESGGRVGLLEGAGETIEGRIALESGGRDDFERTGNSTFESEGRDDLETRAGETIEGGPALESGGKLLFERGGRAVFEGKLIGDFAPEEETGIRMDSGDLIPVAVTLIAAGDIGINGAEFI